jgi:hypothetical protein
MPRTRISTTVDDRLLAEARSIGAFRNDSVLMDEALRAFLASRRAARIDAAYEAYDTQPLGEPDEWGDLEAFRRAAGST